MPIFGMSLVWKLLAVVLVALAAAGAGFGYGHSTGFEAGEKSKLPEIAALTKTINDERIATANKVSSLEQQAAKAATVITKEAEVRTVVKTQVITKYNTVYRTVAEKPSLSTPTVNAVNEIIAVDDEITPVAFPVTDIMPAPDPTPPTSDKLAADIQLHSTDTQK